MVDTMEPQPSRAPELTTTQNKLHERFDKLRKWHKEQEERLRSIQEIRRNKVQEENLNACLKLGDLELQEKNGTNLETTAESYTEVNEKSSMQKIYDGRTNLKAVSFKSDGYKQVNTSLQTNDEEMPIKSMMLDGTSFEELLEQKLSHEKSHKESEESLKPTKRLFLRKGAGLKRYYSKTPQWMQNRKKISPKKKNQLATQNKNPHHLITKLKLQRAQCADIHDHKGYEEVHENSVPVNIKDYVSLNRTEKNLLSSNIRKNKPYLNFASSEKCNSDFTKHSKELEKEHQIESIELAEFEMLEEAAENTSFVSDCSLMADETRNDKILPMIIEKENSSMGCNVTCNKNQDASEKEHCVDILEENLITQSTQLQKLLHAVKSRHQVLLNKISDINCLENKDSELTVVGEDDLTESDRGDVSEYRSVTKLPVMLAAGANINSSFSKAIEDNDDCFNDDDSWKDSIHLDSASISETESEDSAHRKESECQVINGTANKDDNKKENKIVAAKFIEEEAAVVQRDIEHKKKVANLQSTSSDISIESTYLLAERYNIQKKTKELEEEISLFKKENELLIVLRKQREQALQQMEKERIEVANYKEEIKKALEEEVNEGRRQLYRERQNFERYQKMKKDYPDKKEREVISTLRQQIEKLQNDLKKLEMKSSAETRRLKNRLLIVEKERDGLKIAVKQLESQRVELLAVLKENQGKKKLVKKAIIALPHDDLPQTSVIKNKPVDEQSSNENEEVQNKKIDENYNTCKEVKSDTSEKAAEKSNENFEERNMPLVEITNKNNNNDSTETHPNNKKLLSKKNQKVQFSGIPDDDMDQLLNTKKKKHGQKVENIYSNGDREITFPSGTRKHVSSDGLTITINFYNGDWKQVLPDQRVIYHYAETKTTQTVYPDGSEIIEFSNGQIESHSPNGTKNVVLPDGSKCTFYTDGSEKTVTVDGTVIKVDENGTETLNYPNGETEIRNQEFKKRKYPDGTVKILYIDGREETRYSNGRMRIKGKDGDVILDIQLPEL